MIGVIFLTAQELEALVQAKFTEALEAENPPKKFLITENGRGVVDGGDLYNAVIKDVLAIVQRATADILKETLNK